jgi:hypothetical protein
VSSSSFKSANQFLIPLKLVLLGGSIDLIGLDDYWEAGPGIDSVYRALDPGVVKILLSHNPDINYDLNASKKRIDLVLSGHTHGGQVVLPFVGAPFMPSLFGQKYRVGLVRDGARQTFVTTGVGVNFIPFRYDCPAESALIELVCRTRRAASAAPGVCNRALITVPVLF